LGLSAEEIRRLVQFIWSFLKLSIINNKLILLNTIY
jgi:hypothetical protein